MKLFKKLDVEGASEEFLYRKFWRTDITKFCNGTHHAEQPKVTWGFKVRHPDMTAGGKHPHCRIFRLWIYTKGPAYCVDFRKPKWMHRSVGEVQKALYTARHKDSSHLPPEQRPVQSSRPPL